MASRYGGITGSKNISEDFQNINVAFENVQTEMDANKGIVESHLTSTAAHKATDITYTGQVPGNDVKEAIDNVNGRISEIVAQSGDDNTEIVDARGGYTVLSERLDAADAERMNKSEWYVNVKDFGAVGDDTNNDTTAIQQALEYAIANKRALYFPRGVYSSDTIFYGSRPYATQISIFGEDKNHSVIQKRTADGKSLFQISDPTATNFTSGITIENLTFSGIAGDTPNAVVAYDLVLSRFENCSFKNAEVGMRSAGGITNEYKNCAFLSNFYGVVLDKFESNAGGGFPNNNTFFSCQIGSNTSWGVFFDNGLLLNIDSCDIETNGTTGVNSGAVFVGPGVTTYGGSTLIGVNIEKCWFEANTGDASIQLHGGRNKITDSHFIANPNTTYDIHILGGRYELGRLGGNNQKPANVFEHPEVAAGNRITDCDFANISYDPKKTTVSLGSGRILARSGEVPVVSNLIAPLIQTGIDTTESGTAVVIFSQSFSTPPVIFTQQINNNPSTLGVVEVYNVSATGFTMRKKSLTSGSNNIGTENFAVHWLAIGQT